MRIQYPSLKRCLPWVTIASSVVPEDQESVGRWKNYESDKKIVQEMATDNHQTERRTSSTCNHYNTHRSTGACHGSSSQIVRSQVSVCGPIPRHCRQHLQTFLSHAASRRQRTGIKIVFTYLFTCTISTIHWNI